MKLFQKPVSFLLLLLLIVSCGQIKEVDLIIHNATIYTVDGTFSKAEAIAIHGDTIVELGPEHQIRNKYTGKRTIDAAGKAVFPGFIDAHGHLLGYGLGLRKLDLVGTSSFEEVIEKVVEFAKKTNSDWIVGRGWDQNDWEVKDYPTNDTLNRLFPDRPVVLRRVDGHALLANKAALDLAGITKGGLVNGGEIKAKGDGTLTGILIDAAMDQLLESIPKPSEEEIIAALKQAQDTCSRLGLTGIGEPGLSLEAVEVMKSMIEADELKLRIHAMLSADNSIIPFMKSGTATDPRLNIRSVKVYCDGALGSRGAFLKEPYSDDSLNQGYLITGEDSLRFWAELCKQSGFQMNVHCIGDSANALTLKVMNEVLGGTNDLRWRIEHAQVVSPSDRKLFGASNVIPSVQPTHAISDMPWLEDRLGKDRMTHGYAYKSLMKENGLICLGTDFPVESPNPIMTFYTAVERKTKDGVPPSGFQPEEALTREEALRGMTIWAAIANFQEEFIGSLEVGKRADLIMLDRDIMTCGAQLIPETRVTLTVFDGIIVYENP